MSTGPPWRERVSRPAPSPARSLRRRGPVARRTPARRRGRSRGRRRGRGGDRHRSGRPGLQSRQGWLDADEDLDAPAIADRLRDRVEGVLPAASFRIAEIEGPPGAQAVARALRKAVRAVEAEIVFIGSDDAGSIVVPVASETGYPVHSVRTA